jgi:putative ubiquitin-RnfH superfamily antitoxin RatB of RatAB toxin-antitoxin module
MRKTTIDVQVVYAQAGRQILLNVRLPQGATVGGAIDAAGMAAMISPLCIDGRRIGIFSRKVALDHVVEQGDRIEIYRPLTIDPMDARRRRAR